jgi:hypothetical protein
LLIFDTLIGCEEDIKSGGFRRRKKFAILQSRQSGVTRPLAIMTGQMVPESLINAFVDQNAHLGAGDQNVFRLFEGGDRRFARDGGKALQEVSERFAAFQIVE